MHVAGICSLKHYVAPDIVAGNGNGIHRLLTTRDHLRRERASISIINQLKDSTEAIAPDFVPGVLLPGEQWQPGKLSQAQGHVISSLLQSRDGVAALRGVAGAGKTSSLAVFDSAARERGYTTVYLAPTHEAAEVLRGSGFEHVHTVSRFLVDSELQETLPEKSIVITDESGLLSTVQGAALVEIAQARSARLVLVGDAAQHTSVEAGDWLRTMEQHSNLETYALTEIHRQQHAEYREAAKLMAVGHVRAGLEKLDSLGWIVETPEIERAIAADYLAARDGGKDHIAVAPTHAVIRAATAEIRSGLIERGMLGSEASTVTISESLAMTTAQKRDLRNYEPDQLITFTQRVEGFATARAYTVEDIVDGSVLLRSHTGKLLAINIAAVAARIDVARRREIDLRTGDRIMVRANDTKANLRNSEVLTFDSLNASGGIRTREGKIIPPGMLALVYGYVITSHKSQGQTRGYAGIVGGFDAKAIYVSATRAKHAVRIYTPDKQALFRSAERPGSRLAALEAFRPPRRKDTPKIMNTPTHHDQVREACLAIIDARLARLKQATAEAGGVSPLSADEQARVSSIKRPYTKAELDRAARPRLEQMRVEALRLSTMKSTEQEIFLAQVSALGGDSVKLQTINDARRKLATPPRGPSVRKPVSNQIIAEAEAAKRQISQLRNAGHSREAGKIERETLLTRINATRIADGKPLLSARDLKDMRRGYSPAQRLTGVSKALVARVKTKLRGEPKPKKV